MPAFRFSLAGLGTVVALLCFHLAGWISRSSFWGGLSMFLFLGMLGIALCGMIAGTDHRRPFFTGVAVFGIGFWVWSYLPLTDSRSASGWMGGRMTTVVYNNPNVPTGPVEELLNWVESSFGSRIRTGDQVVAIWRGGGWYSAIITQDYGDGTFDVQWDDGSPIQRTPRHQIQPVNRISRQAGRAFLGTLVALLGGILSALLFVVKSNSNNDGHFDKNKLSLSPAPVKKESPLDDGQPADSA